MKRHCYTIILFLVIVLSIHAEIQVSNVFSSHMILQQQKPVSVWGTGEVGEQVRVTFAGQTQMAITDNNGHWQVTLKAMKASTQPQTMTISSQGKKIRFTDVLIGEVWLASGQSNMEYSMNNHPQYKKPKKGDPDFQLKEWKNADNPNIRMLYIRKDLKCDTLPTNGWQRLCPENVKPVSAVAYFFAKMLQDSLKIPVGIISSSWGGTVIEEWTPNDEPNNSLRPMYQKLIKPLVGYTLRGFLWYQGESNLINYGDTHIYAQKQEQLFTAWRKLWKDDFLPFYYVQISPLTYSQRKGDSIPKTWIDLPRFWTAQAKTMKLPNTGMVVTTDIPDDIRDIHPPYKWVVGERLCRWALNRTYGFKHIEYASPILKNITRKGDKVIIEFNHAKEGLITSDGKSPTWFYANTADGRFCRQNVVIDGNSVILHISKNIQHPTIRFGYDEIAQPNLRNHAGLPGLPFEITL